MQSIVSFLIIDIIKYLPNNYLNLTTMIKEKKWAIDPVHSEISFQLRHLMIAHVKGSFKKFDANIYTSGKDFSTAQIDVWIDASSINTGDAKRDEHVKSADFLDVQNHKQITFTSSSIGQSEADGHHELWGELTIAGVTKNIKLDVHLGGIINDPWGNEKAGFTITGKINRSDWGLTWNSPMENGGLIVSDEVTISCEVELIAVDQTKLTMELDSNGKKENN